MITPRRRVSEAGDVLLIKLSHDPGWSGQPPIDVPDVDNRLLSFAFARAGPLIEGRPDAAITSRARGFRAQFGQEPEGRVRCIVHSLIAGTNPQALRGMLPEPRGMAASRRVGDAAPERYCVHAVRGGHSGAARPGTGAPRHDQAVTGGDRSPLAQPFVSANIRGTPEEEHSEAGEHGTLGSVDVKDLPAPIRDRFAERTALAERIEHSLGETAGVVASRPGNRRCGRAERDVANLPALIADIERLLPQRWAQSANPVDSPATARHRLTSVQRSLPHIRALQPLRLAFCSSTDAEHAVRR